MRFGIPLAITVFLVCTDVRAQQVPGIDRPTAEVAEQLGSIFQCRMTSGLYETGCDNAQVILDLWRNSARDIFDTAEFTLLIAMRPRQQTPEERATIGAVIEALAYLAPTWSNSREWLASAIAAAGQQRACSYIIIDGVVVSIMPLRPVDTPGRYAEIYVTRNFDIYSLCEY